MFTGPKNYSLRLLLLCLFLLYLREYLCDIHGAQPRVARYVHNGFHTSLVPRYLYPDDFLISISQREYPNLYV